ncbi:30S ribosomal protein S20 [Bacillus kwashiorkori]|uniref:30S ribosomal protein S20 n=1 Tax=Bacillus kwashiorkori TaxID=1522318 RepID=UPI000783CB8C|nr:30S ribosomal protein S20 [Bacillus kwashiorkori]
MANIKSAIKRINTNETKRVLNKSAKSDMRTAIKQVELAIVNNDASAAKTALPVAIRKIDKAVTKGLIHKNAAARHKSRLQVAVNKLEA